VQNYGKKDTLQRILFFFCAEAAYFRNFLEYYCFSLPYLKIKSVPLRREMRKHSFQDGFSGLVPALRERAEMPCPAGADT
jgi:hypothetical protein